jgi:hypothetical protein
MAGRQTAACGVHIITLGVEGRITGLLVVGSKVEEVVKIILVWIVIPDHFILTGGGGAALSVAAGSSVTIAALAWPVIPPRCFAFLIIARGDIIPCFFSAGFGAVFAGAPTSAAAATTTGSRLLLVITFGRTSITAILDVAN